MARLLYLQPSYRLKGNEINSCFMGIVYLLIPPASINILRAGIPATKVIILQLPKYVNYMN